MRGSQKNINYKTEWSPDFAYGIGLLTTDGCLFRNGKTIEFTSKDKQLVETFKDCLNIEGVKIGKKPRGGIPKKLYNRIEFCNTKLYKWLLTIGLMPAKSKIIGEIKVPDEYFFDFLRGVFDGDGSCYGYWDKRWDSSFMFYTKFYSASNRLILWLREKIYYSLGIKGDLHHTCRNGNSPVYQLKYAKRESKILLAKMYYKTNLPCLKRKSENIIEILNSDAKETLKHSGRVLKPVYSLD